MSEKEQHKDEELNQEQAETQREEHPESAAESSEKQEVEDDPIQIAEIKKLHPNLNIIHLVRESEEHVKY